MGVLKCLAFAAIKGLHDEAQEQAAKMESLQTENNRLAVANAELEKRLRKLEKLLLPSDLASAN
jgi:regulator of replication initiation timing